jgi:hypothetical protein
MPRGKPILSEMILIQLKKAGTSKKVPAIPS